MKETAHLRITAQEAKELYLSGLFNAQTYLYILVRALRKDGWWLYFNVKEFCQEWGIPERSFYRAKAILVSKGYLEEDIQGRIGLRCPVEEENDDTATSGSPTATCGSGASAISGGTPATCGGTSATCGGTSAISGGWTATCGSEGHPKPAQDKASTAPSDLDQISFRSFSDLLQRERDEKCLSKNEEATAIDGLVDPEPAGGVIDVAKILEETKKKLLAEVERQREQRRGKNFRGWAALGALEAAPLTRTGEHSHGGHGQHHGQWEQGDSPRLTSTVATGSAMSGYGGHGGHYGWRVRGGGLQPLANTLAAAIMRVDLLSREGSP